jgi:hypothetical protein
VFSIYCKNIHLFDCHNHKGCHLIKQADLTTRVVSCADDNEPAVALCTFLSGRFPGMKTSIVKDEIYIESTTDRSITPSEVNSALTEFRLPDRSFEKCIVNGIGDSFVVAFQVDVEEIGLHKCQWCSCPLKSGDESEIHEKECPYRFIF